MMMEYLICLFFIVWFSLSICHQFWPKSIALLPNFFTKFIPSWSFFAPYPPDSDNELVIWCNPRSDGVWESCLSSERQDWYSFALNRNSLRNKVLIDAANILLDHQKSLKEGKDSLVQLSPIYISLLNESIKRSRELDRPKCEYIRFSIIRLGGTLDGELQMQFLSKEHKVA